MALCSQVFSHTFHFSAGTHNKLWLDFVKKTHFIYAERRSNDSSSLYFMLRRESQGPGGPLENPKFKTKIRRFHHFPWCLFSYLVKSLPIF